MNKLLAIALSLLLATLARAETLTVSAAASLTDALRKIGPQFEAAHPGVELRFNFGASGLLVQQLRQGAPVDLLLTADLASMDQAASLGLIRPDTRINFAGNVLVLIEAAKSAAPLRQLADLTQPAVRRIAIGKPTSVPAGRYAREVLEAAGLWDTLQPRLVPADNVRQALDYVARGEVQAGFVYLSDASTQADKLRVVQRFDVAVRYPGAITQATQGSPRAALAAALLLYLRSREAQAILAQRGFTPP